MSQDFTVRLDRVFQGPMDLLLHLVKEQEVEIHEVEIHRVIEGYFQYLQALEDLDIEVAGEFLVMAATLMAIKSRSLLPREEVELDDELDPEDELIQRLLDYRRFKGAADDLEQRFERRSLEHYRGFTGELREHTPEKQLDLGELTSFDLLAAFSRLMRETLANRPHRVTTDARPLRWYVRSVGHAIHGEGEVGLRRLVQLAAEEAPHREGVIGVFCALLELIKLGVVSASQEEPGEEIRVRLEADSEEDLDDLIGASRFMDEDELDDGLIDSEAAAAQEAAPGAGEPAQLREEADEGPPEGEEIAGLDPLEDPRAALGLDLMVRDPESLDRSDPGA